MPEVQGGRHVRPNRWQPGKTLFGAIGLISVGLFIGVAELLSALGEMVGVLHNTSSPLTALGNSFIVRTPEWLKRWAIREFGTGDKIALLTGMGITLVVFAVLIGIVARRNLDAALFFCVLLVGVTLLAVWTRSGSAPADGFPSMVGSAAGIFLLIRAHRITIPPADRGSDQDRSTPVSQPGSGDVVESDADPQSPGAGLPMHRRRRFLRMALLGAVVAAVSGGISRLIPSAADVEASRARIKIATPADSQLINTTGPPSTSAPSRSSAAPRSSSRSSTAGPSSGTSAESPTTSATAASASTTGASTTSEGASASSGAARSATTAASSTNPSAFNSVKGLSPFVTPNSSFYRVDTTLTPPLLTAENWSLRIHGQVANEITINYAELMARKQLERAITLTCVSNYVGGQLVGNAMWIGARIQDLLVEAVPSSGADCVLSTSIDGFTSSTPLSTLMDGRDALLAVGMNGQPLPIQHGFPVRMVVPGLYGYVGATKWVVDLEVTRFSVVTSYWTARGWSDQGPVKTSSRIDVPSAFAQISPGQKVTIAGVAWAQHRGISAVEIQIDNGPWLKTSLAGAFSTDTWRQWRYLWTATMGQHIIRCRATDGTGALQDAAYHDPAPNGATGYASIAIGVY